jgi:hypothetical protein
MAKGAYHFFFSQAGYGYDPKTETVKQGRARGARELAAAEARARVAGVTFDWQEDDEPFECGRGDPACASSHEPSVAYGCILRDQHGDAHDSLWGISFGPDSGPFPYDSSTTARNVVCHEGRYMDPYARVVQAELALQYFHKIDKEAKAAGPDPFNLAGVGL